MNSHANTINHDNPLQKSYFNNKEDMKIKPGYDTDGTVSTVVTKDNSHYHHHYNKPYLTLKERLSQVWFNYYTIALILVIIKLYLFKTSLLFSLQTAKLETYSQCSKLELFAESVSNLPRYISIASNQLVAQTMQEANKAFYNGLNMLFQITEELILFTIEVTIGTYACILTATVDGAVEVAVNATEAIMHLANDTIISFANDLEDGLGDLTSVVNTIIDTINDVEDFFTGDDSSNVDNSIDHVNLTIAALRDWSIPSSINADLEYVYDNIPDYDDVLNYTESFIDSPFTVMRDLIDEQVNSTNLIPTADQMYVPQLQDSVSYCTDNKNIAEFYGDMEKLIDKVFIILLVILLVGSIAAMGYFLFRIHQDWKRLNMTVAQLQIIDEQKHLHLDSDSRYRKLEVLEDMRNVWVSRISCWVIKLLRFNKIDTPFKRARRENTVKWVIYYISSPLATTLLLVSLAGILMFIVQFILLVSINNIDTTDLKNGFNEVGLGTMKTVNDSVSSWANNTNIYITRQQDSINDNLLGMVHNSSAAINSTVSEFVDSMNDKLEEIFGSTPLYTPIQSIVGCVITNKLEKIEKGLTWINEHSTVTIPTIDPNEMLKSIQNNNSENSDQINSLIKDTVNGLQSTKNLVYSTFRTMILTELYVSLALFGIWFLTLVLAIILVLLKNWLNKKSQDRNEHYSNSYDNQLSISDPIPLSNPISPRPSMPKVTTPIPILSAPLIPQISKFQSLPEQYYNNDSDYSFNDSNISNRNSLQFDTPENSLTENKIYNNNPFTGPGLINQTLNKVYDSLKKTPLRHLDVDKRQSTDSTFPLKTHINPIPFSLPGLQNIPSLRYSNDTDMPPSSSNKENINPYTLNSPFQSTNSRSFSSRISNTFAPRSNNSPNIEMTDIDFDSSPYHDPTINTARRWN